MPLTHKLETIITNKPMPLLFGTPRNLQSFNFGLRNFILEMLTLRILAKRYSNTRGIMPRFSLGNLSRLSISPSIVCVFPLPVWEKQHTHNKFAHKTQFPILIQHHHSTKALENYYQAKPLPSNPCFTTQQQQKQDDDDDDNSTASQRSQKRLIIDF